MFRLVTLMSVLATVSTCVAQEKLEWKLRPNETLNYQVSQQMETLADIGGVQNRSTMSQAMKMSWNVQSSGANGETVIHQIVDRIKMEMDNGAAGKISYDSANAEKSDNPMVQAMGNVFQNIVGKTFTVTMLPTGKVNDVKVPNELMNAIRNSASGAAQVLDEKSLKDMMKQSAVTLPEGDVKVGDTWKSQQAVPLPFGQMNISSVMTFSGKDENGNAIIDVVPSVSVVPAEGAMVKASLTDAKGKGRVVFDMRNGRVQKSELVLTMKLIIELVAQKQTFPQTINQKTMMELQ